MMSVSRSRLRVMLCVLIGLLCLSLPGLFQAQSEQGAVVLLTEEEADRLRLTEEQLEWGVRFNRGTMSGESDPDGPRIVFQAPDLGDGGKVETTTPLNLAVAFEPRNDPISIESLRVVARKGIFRKDMTELVLPYVAPTENGWKFGIANVQIPAGRFRIEIAIADEGGRPTERTYYFTVSTG